MLSHLLQGSRQAPKTKKTSNFDLCRFTISPFTLVIGLFGDGEKVWSDPKSARWVRLCESVFQRDRGSKLTRGQLVRLIKRHPFWGEITPKNLPFSQYLSINSERQLVHIHMATWWQLGPHTASSTLCCHTPPGDTERVFPCIGFTC